MGDPVVPHHPSLPRSASTSSTTATTTTFPANPTTTALRALFGFCCGHPGCTARLFRVVSHSSIYYRRRASWLDALGQTCNADEHTQLARRPINEIKLVDWLINLDVGDRLTNFPFSEYARFTNVNMALASLLWISTPPGRAPGMLVRRNAYCRYVSLGHLGSFKRACII